MITKTTPYEYQRQAVQAAMGRDAFAYLMEQGTGKSLCLIADAISLYYEKDLQALVIVAPKGCYLNWPRNELPKHIHPEVPYRCETWLAPSRQGIDKTRKLEHFRDIEMPFFKILVVNVEALAFSATYDYLAKFLRKHDSMMAIDESTSIRTPSSKRCMYARRLGALAKYRRILTGTPIANRPLDLYGQCAFLGANLLGFPTFQTFKHYYADIGYFRGGKRLDPDKENIRGPGIYPVLVGYRHLEELTENLNQFSFRVLKKDCLDLPDKVYVTRYVEPTKEQTRMYNTMRADMMSAYEVGKYTTATLALTQIMRLHTILCGHIKLDDGETVSIENNRVDAWREIVDEVDGKIITFCLYREDIKQLIKDLPQGSYAEYHGGVDTNTRAENLARFQNDPLCLHFFATQSTGGTGLTLNEAHTVIYYSQGYDLEKRLQSEDRCHRIGQTNKVTYYSLAVADSVDEKIVESLSKKQNLADTVLLDLKSYLPEMK